MQQPQHYLVPGHYEGFEKDIAHTIAARGIEDAEDWFVDAKERLLDINNWQRYGRVTNVAFTLTDGHGKAVRRSARRGDHIRIEMLATDGDMTRGFDWATIEAIEYDDYPDDGAETFAIRIHPSDDPGYKNVTEPFLFLGHNASSTFVIAREMKQLSAIYHGRNEPVFATGAEADVATLDTDMPVTCWLGLADTQWEDLMKGLLK